MLSFENIKDILKNKAGLITFIPIYLMFFRRFNDISLILKICLIIGFISYIILLSLNINEEDKDTL